MNLDHMLAQLRGARPSDILQPDSNAKSAPDVRSRFRPAGPL